MLWTACRVCSGSILSRNGGMAELISSGRRRSLRASGARAGVDGRRISTARLPSAFIVFCGPRRRAACTVVRAVFLGPSQFWADVVFVISALHASRAPTSAPGREQSIIGKVVMRARK